MEPYWLAHHRFFKEHWTLPNRSTFLDRESQNRNKFASNGPTFSVYTRDSWTLGKPYGTKLGCYSECLGENLGNQMGTHTSGTSEKNPLPSSLSPYVMQSDKLWSRLHAITAADAPFMHPKNGRKELSTWKRGWSSSASCLPEVMYLYCVTGVDILYGEADGRCSWIHLLLLTIITTANWWWWWWWVSCLKFLTAWKLLQNQLGAYLFVFVITML